MTDKQVFYLAHAEARRRAVQAVQQAPDGFKVTVQPPGRSLDQSAKFHAMCGELSKSGLEWHGKPRTAEQWKVLLISGHAVATKQGAEFIPGIESEFVNIRESTAAMSKGRLSSLIEYTAAFMATMGVEAAV